MEQEQATSTTDKRGLAGNAREGKVPYGTKRTINGPGFLVFHKGLILVFSPLVIQLILISSLAVVLLKLDQESAKESRYRRCAAIGAHLIALEDLAAIDVIAWFQSGNRELMKAYDNAAAGINTEEKQLRELSKIDAQSKKSASDLMDTINGLRSMLDSVVVLAKGNRILEMATVIPGLDKEFKKSKNTHLEHLEAVTETQARIADESTLRQERLSYMQRQIILYGLIANAIVALLLYLFFKNNILMRLQVVRKNTDCLDGGRPLASELTEQNDEIGQLDQAFHRMDAELRAAIERERSLFENASDVICVVNTASKFERINPACLKHWGFRPDEIMFSSLEAVVAEKDAALARSLFRTARQGGDAASFELLLRRKDGTSFEALWSTYWSEQEELLFCVVHDISERKRIERMKHSYMAMISSDLRKPLASIAAAADALAGEQAKNLTQKAQERVQIVKTNLGRLLLLVNDLLEMSALESGTLSLAKELSKVQPLLVRSAHDLEGLAVKRKIQFRIECNAQDCLLDQNRIMQVIVNLASNAVKFSPEGGEVALLASSDGDFLTVKVSDQGRGVPETHKKAIFEKFKQVEASDGKRQAGTGLGLPICKDLVEEHGGEIGVESQPGQGSTFWFTLPLNTEVFERIVAQRLEQSRKLASKKQTATQLDPSLIDTQKFGAIVPPKAKEKARFVSLSKKGILLIALPLAIELVFVLSVLTVISEVGKHRAEELKQRQIAATIYKVLNAMNKMIVTITPASQEQYWLAFDQCCRQEQEARRELARLLRNDKAELRLFKQADNICAKLDPNVAELREAIDRDGYSNELFDKLHPDRIVIIAINSGVARRLLGLVDAVEKKEAVSPGEQAKLRRLQGMILLCGLAVNVILSLLLAKFFARNISTRLATLADNTTRLARSVPLNQVIPGNDEIAQLDIAFHLTAEKLDEARRKERAVFDNSHDLIAALDGDLHLVASNPAAERLLGYTGDELEQKTLLELIAEDQRDRAKQFFLSDTFEKNNTSETKIIRQDGATIYLLWAVSRPEKGKNAYCVAHDISDRKQLEQLKQDFLAVVSHDLRNPLGSVIGFITLIKAGAMGLPGPEAVPFLDKIIHEADKLLCLINDLLDLEKLEAQSMQLELSRESAGKITYLAFESVCNKFSDAKLDLADSSAELELDCDRERLMQAVTNIFLHICRRCSDESARASAVTLNVSILQNDKQEICWQIANPGPDYNSVEQAQLFERFRTSSESDADSCLPNTGMALPIAKRIIKAHGGNLELIADKSQQVQFFRFSLPESVVEAEAVRL